MEKQYNRLLLNLGLLLSGCVTIFSGLLMQIQFHMGNHGHSAINNQALGLNYNGWSYIHKISILILSLIMIFHISQHWKWYKIVMKKRLIAKNAQVLTLSIVFILVAITGLIPWFMTIMKGHGMLRKVLIEIHDKLAIILAIYLILHVFKRLKWFYTTFKNK